jgi:hypothetical protein
MITFTPMPSVGLGLGQSVKNGKFAQAFQSVLVPFIQQVKSEIIDPVEQKTGKGVVFHIPPAEIQAAMLPVCGAGPSLTGDIGVFLTVTRCWLDEVFGQWAAFEQVGLQTKAIGDALNNAAKGVEERVKQSSTVLSVLASTLEAVRTAKGIAAKFVTMGQRMIQIAQQQKKTARGMRKLGPDIRDAVILFNDAIDTGEITVQNPAIVQVKTGLEEVVTSWRRMVVQQIDLALYASKYAQKIVIVNNRLIEAQFSLALVTPELFAIADGLIKIIDDLLESISIFVWPAQALNALAELPGKIVRGVVEALTDPAAEALKKTAWVVAGLGVLAVGGAIFLKKYGVIGKLKGD